MTRCLPRLPQAFALFLLAMSRPVLAQPTMIIMTPVNQSARDKQPAPLQRPVTIDLQDMPLRLVLHEINRQAGLRLSYSPATVPVDMRVSLRVRNVSAERALEMVLQTTGVHPELGPSGQVLLVKGHEGERGRLIQGGVIGGRVTDSASGKGIGGATVLVKGTALRTTTGDNGQFTLKAVPAGEQTLTVRAFGYKPQTLTVTVTDGERTSVSVALVSTPTVLSGVVTQVSGVQERRQVGTDITVLKADSIMQVAPVSTVTDLLETRVPGLTVLRESGIPGAPRRVRLRGTSSPERSNDPIFIVDGVRRSEWGPEYDRYFWEHLLRSLTLRPDRPEQCRDHRGLQGAQCFRHVRR